MSDTVKVLLERQAERRRKRRVRALQNAACAVLAAVCILCLAQLDAEDRAAAMESESAPVQSIAYVAEPVRKEPQEDPEAAQEPQEPDYIIEDVPLPADLQITLHDAAEEFGVDYYIMLALIEQESDYRNINGDGGDSIGYCQIQPKWWTGLMEEIGATDLTDPEDNFRTACAILAELTDKHGLEYALTSYNRGKPGESEYAREVMARAEVISDGHDQ